MAFRATKLTLAVGLVGVVAATAAACTSSNSSGASGSSGGSSGGDSVSVIQSQGVLNFAVDNIAQTEGFFKKQGLNVKINYGAGDAVTDPAVLSGGDDFGIGTTLPLFKYKSSGKDPLIVSAVDDQLTQEVGINKDKAKQLGIKPGMPIEKAFPKLKGKNVNVGVLDIGGSLQLTFTAIAKNFGLSEGKDFHFTAIKSYQSLIVAEERGQVDMVVFGMPYGSQAVSQGKSQDFVDLWKGSYKPYAGAIFGGLFTTNKYAKAHPSTVKKMSAAINEGLAFIHQNPQKALQDINKADPGTSMDVLKELMVTNKGEFFADQSTVDPKAYAVTQKVASETGTAPAQNVAYNDLVWSGAKPSAGS